MGCWAWGPRQRSIDDLLAAYLKSGGVRVLFRVFENLRHGPRNDAPAWWGEEWRGRRKDGISYAKRARMMDHIRHVNS